MSASDSSEVGAIEVADWQEHVRKKCMWAGSPVLQQIPGLIGLNEEGHRLDLSGDMHCPVLLATINELITNASDQVYRSSLKKSGIRVSFIKVAIDRTGLITIHNDGPGIPIYKHEKASTQKRRNVSNVEAAFTILMAGSNISKSKNSVTGGTNGIGAKLAVGWSTRFTIETVDHTRQLWYSQVLENSAYDINPPTQRKIKTKNPKPYTKITYSPDWVGLGYTDTKDEQLNDYVYESLLGWVRYRVACTASYVGATSKKCVEISFNDEVLSNTFKDAEGLSKLMTHPEAALFPTIVKCSGGDQPPWNICAAVHANTAKFSQLSVVNGVVSIKSTQIEYIKRAITTAVRAEICRLLNRESAEEVTPATCCKELTLISVCPLPGIDWDAQKKDSINAPAVRYTPFDMPVSWLAEVAAVLAKKVAERIHAAGGKKTGKREVKPPASDKYEPAVHAGKAKYKKDTILMLAEGDSAATFLRQGIKQKKGDLDFNLCALATLGGVPMNARRFSELVVLPLDGSKHIVRSEKLEQNMVFNMLERALNLSHTRTYETSEELDTLRYGKVVICVDQDVDGTGKILGLTLTFFQRFWPALVATGYFHRFITPIVRATPKGVAKKNECKIMEFFYEQEFDAWHDSLTSAEKSKYSYKYYKGLGGHSKAEVERMFTKGEFHKRLLKIPYNNTEDAHYFETYFGNSSSERKLVLSVPVEFPSPSTLANTLTSGIMPCSMIFEVDTKLFKLEALKRQIPNVMDGLNLARRKVIAAMRKRVAADGNGEMKVYQVTSYTALHMYYEHGDASLNSTVITMAQYYNGGGRKLPLLNGVGQFGSRHNGIADAASPRYISVTLNKPLVDMLFPIADTFLLKCVTQEGHYAEPEYYIPTIPLAILESAHLPSEGWAHKSFARCADSVVALIRSIISGEMPEFFEMLNNCADATATMIQFEHDEMLPICSRGFKGSFESVVTANATTPCSKGIGHYDKKTNVIRITELPLGTSTNKYVNALRKRLNFEENDDDNTAVAKKTTVVRENVITNYGDVDTVELTVQLDDGQWHELLARYKTEANVLRLYSSLVPNLTFMTPSGTIMDCGMSYFAPIISWFPQRRDLYAKRLEREAIILELRIVLIDSIILYLYADATARAINGSTVLTDIPEEYAARIPDLVVYPRARTEDVMNERLKAAGFLMYDATLAEKPAYTPVDKLHDLVTAGENASYSYILNLRERDRVQSAINKRLEKLEFLRKELAQVQEDLISEPFPGARVWLHELSVWESVRPI
jgi:DNA gyrase/topoisomerase IV subunit B